MHKRLYAQLCAMARRDGADAHLAEDIVQDALVAAIEAGRHDLGDAETRRWLAGVVRNKGRMARRSAGRRRRRDGDWVTAQPPASAQESLIPTSEILRELPPALRCLAALVLTGHNRREIAYLLGLPDTALRQRVTALKRALVARGLAVPAELSGLNLGLAYGRIRDALLPALVRHGGLFASHDPDGHLFIVARSQKPPARQ